MSDQAWLDKRQGRYVIRFNDWAKLRPTGKPRVGFHSLVDEAGQPVRTLAAATSLLAAFIARMPPPPSQARRRNKGTVIVPDRRTIVQIAWAWHRAHPKNTSRDAYMRAAQWVVDDKQLGITYPHEMNARAVTQLKTDRGGVGVNKPFAYLRSILQWAALKAELIDPLDLRLLKALAQPQSRKSRKDLLTVAQWQATMDACHQKGAHYAAIGHCISTYCWRPSTACRIRIRDIDLDRQWIFLRHVKDTTQDKHHDPVEHYLHRETIDLLRPIMDGRDGDEPVFLYNGRPWCVLDPAKPGYGNGAPDFSDWYRRVCKPLTGDSCGNVNAWRRFALWRMEDGIAPWPKALIESEVRSHTGHEDLTVLRRYRRTNDTQLRKLVGIEDDEPIIIDDGTETAPVVWSGVRDKPMLTDADESVSFPRVSQH